MMTESATTLSRPPSVAVAPVRGITLTPCSSANRRISATCAVLRAMTTAAGTGMVWTSKMFCSLRKLSTLLCDEDVLVGDDVLRPHDALQALDDGFSAQWHAGVPLRVRGWPGGQWKIDEGLLEDRVRGVVDGPVRGLVHPSVDVMVHQVGGERLAARWSCLRRRSRSRDTLRWPRPRRWRTRGSPRRCRRFATPGRRTRPRRCA